MSRITKDGIFKGKNKVFYDKDGNAISALEYHVNKMAND